MHPSAQQPPQRSAISRLQGLARVMHAVGDHAAPGAPHVLHGNVGKDESIQYPVVLAR